MLQLTLSERHFAALEQFYSKCTPLHKTFSTRLDEQSKNKRQKQIKKKVGFSKKIWTQKNVSLKDLTSITTKKKPSK